MKCEENGCELQATTQGYCKKHYMKYYRKGIIKPLIKVRGLCKIDNCANIAYTDLGYCKRHYIRIHRYGNPNIVKIELHNKSNTKEYSIWRNMKDRCYNQKNKAYKNYGGRGILVCNEWKNSFSKFYEDMGDIPKDKQCIERINNNLGYSKENCKWATNEENARNKRSNVIDEEGVKKIRKEYKKGKSSYKIFKEYNMSYTNIKDILRNKIWRNV